MFLRVHGAHHCPGSTAARLADLVKREFTVAASNRLWVVGFERHEALLDRVGVGDLHRRAVAAAW
ncbi:MAG: hypothetical protein ACRDRH_16325 [Pseudonocardia sp.]